MPDFAETGPDDSFWGGWVWRLRRAEALGKNDWADREKAAFLKRLPLAPEVMRRHARMRPARHAFDEHNQGTQGRRRRAPPPARRLACPLRTLIAEAAVAAADELALPLPRDLAHTARNREGGSKQQCSAKQRS